MFKYIALTLGLLFFCACKTKHVQHASYVVNPGIKSEVDKNTDTFAGGTSCSIQLKIYENDSLIADSYNDTLQLQGHMTQTILRNDTIFITGYIGMLSGFGYSIKVCSDTAIVRFFVKSDENIYRLHPQDSLTDALIVPCTSYALTLTQPLTYKPAEVVQGKVDLASAYFYENANNGEQKLRMEVSSYFRTPPSERR